MPVTTRIWGGGTFHLQPRDVLVEQILSCGKNNKKIPDKIPESYLKALFYSSKTYGLFTTHFDNELYNYAISHYNSDIFTRFRYMYSVLGVAKVLEDVEISNCTRPLHNGMRNFLTENFYKINNDSLILRKFSYCFTANIEICFIPIKGKGNLDLFSLSDDRAKLYPLQSQQGGNGYMIHSYAGNLVIIVETNVEGQISLNLRGLDVRDGENRNKRIPFWIDYTSLTINGTVIFNTIKPTCYDEPCNCTGAVKVGEKITLQVTWIPHMSDK